MTMADDVWAAFSRDPRVPEHRELRASDADREVVQRVLVDAYADGRLDREEFDVRTAATDAARTLGMLVPPLEGLVAAQTSADAGPRALSSADLDRRAVQRWETDRRDAAWGLLWVSAVVWVIWAVTSGVGSFPWPVFVTLVATLNLSRVQIQRTSIVADHREALERKYRKEIEKRRRQDP